jgi:hypothetical protein
MMKNTFKKVAFSLGALLLMVGVASLAVAVEPASTMTRAEAKALILTANTAQDHHRLAAYFTQKAANMEAEAVEHEELVEQYTKNATIHEMKHPMSGKTTGHCRYFATTARKAAAEDRALAAAHEAMAKTAK